MVKLLSLILTAVISTTFMVDTAQAETTKEAWVKKKKSAADERAKEERNVGGSTAGQGRDHNRKVEEKRKAEHREIDETAKRLGDGNQNHKPKQQPKR